MGLTENNIQTTAEVNKSRRMFATAAVLATAALLVFLLINPAFADYTGTIGNVLDQMITIIGTIFQAVGIILSVYAVGQLILAFKNEDANSKSSASMLLVVGIALIALPAIIKSLNLGSLLTG